MIYFKNSLQNVTNEAFLCAQNSVSFQNIQNLRQNQHWTHACVNASHFLRCQLLIGQSMPLKWAARLPGCKLG